MGILGGFFVRILRGITALVVIPLPIFLLFFNEGYVGSVLSTSFGKMKESKIMEVSA